MPGHYPAVWERNRGVDMSDALQAEKFAANNPIQVALDWRWYYADAMLAAREGSDA